MVHLALNEVDDHHAAAHWAEHVSDDEYNARRHGHEPGIVTRSSTT
jgi:hypothetical protein